MESKRTEIATKLMIGCPEDALDDHQKITDAIRRGDDIETILNMVETDRWPDTYVWLKYELSEVWRVG